MAGMSAMLGNAITRHSLARSLASRTAGSLLMEKTSVSIFGFGPQYSLNAR